MLAMLFQGKIGLMGCNGMFMSVTPDGKVLCSSSKVGEQETLQVSRAGLG